MMRRWRVLGYARRMLLAALAVGAIALTPREASADVRAVCNVAEVDALLARFANKRDTIIDKKKFYTLAKAEFSIFKDPGTHYTGTDSVLEYWNTHRELTDLRWLAYIMGTSYHETARRMYPVRETLASTDESVVRILARSSHTKNKTYWKQDGETGQHYYGRGHVQLTWKTNYELADRRLGRDPNDKAKSFKWTADLALDPDDSVEILFDGMIYGWYTQKHCLPFYLDPEGKRREDWKNARRIVNVLDRWQTIADHARKFLAILKQSEVASVVDATVPPVTEPPITEPPITEPPETEPTPEELLAIAEATLVELGGENDRLKAQIVSLRADATQRAQEIDGLRQQKSADDARIAALEQQVADLTARFEALETQNTELAGRVEDSLAEQQRLADLAAAATAETAAANLQLEQAERQLADAKAQLSVATSRNTSLTNRVDALTVEEQRLRLRLSEAETTLRNLQDEANKSWWGGLFGG